MAVALTEERRKVRPRGAHPNAAPRMDVYSVRRTVMPNNPSKKLCFEPYISEKEATRGIANGELFEGSLRINPRNYVESYVDNPDGDAEQDVLILGMQDRNRALHGDIVVIRMKPRCQWLVQDALYDAWRRGEGGSVATGSGQQSFSSTSSGVQAESISVIPSSSSEEKDSASIDEQRSSRLPRGKPYTRDEMLRISKTVSLKDRGNAPGSSNGVVEVPIAKMEVLSLGTPALPSSSAALPKTPLSESSATPSRPTTAATPSSEAAAARRGNNYRFLSTLPHDEHERIPDSCLQKTAQVVFISEAKNKRTAVGTLKMLGDGNRKYALFSPSDSRVPRMMISADQLPLGFFDRPQDFGKFIYAARIVGWPESSQFAKGNLCKQLGMAGDIDAETEGILLTNDVDTREFVPEVLASLPVNEATQWSIPQKEFEYRRDFREETVFTIDPMTARDLDDALHVKEIADCDGRGNAGYEVGVHIADVAFFVNHGTLLDTWAKERATSVYLVHKVIPMLPRILCEELCSLNAGIDRLTFSVVWKMNANGDVYEEWFGRSIIRSCCKLAYEHAQDFIDNPDKEFTLNEFPHIFNNRDVEDIKQSTLLLNKIAENLRRKRGQNGSLRLDQPKLRFALNDSDGMPNAVSIYQRQKAHSLVEEFMLLANMAVARRVEHVFPMCALLRRHPPPKAKVLRDTQQVCKKIGFPVDGASSAQISSGLHRFEGDSELQRTIVQILSHLLLKAMQLAVYFCTGTVKNRADFAHYALAVPFYTHFTSPIRRYPDIMVHRQLAAVLGYSELPEMKVKEIEKIAVHCNDRKLAAKNVSEASEEMFFGVFVKECGPLKERAVVLQVLDQSFDVLVIKYGVVKRVYVNRLGMSRQPVFTEFPLPQLTIFWDREDGGRPVEQLIRMCVVVDVLLCALPEPTKYQASIIRPANDHKPESLSELLKDGRVSIGDEE